MMAIPTYANAVLDSLTRHFDLAKRRGVWKPLAAGAAGFALSAASLANRAMPIALGLLCAAPPGIYAIAIALGGCLGFLLGIAIVVIYTGNPQIIDVIYISCQREIRVRVSSKIYFVLQVSRV